LLVHYLYSQALFLQHTLNSLVFATKSVDLTYFVVLRIRNNSLHMIDRNALAFLLVCGAGGSTCIGAAIVYHPTYIHYANKKTLGAALGMSAGVMLYVSFIEIFGKSQSAFEDAGISEANSYLFATLCFFVGFLLMLALDRIVHLLDPDDIGHQNIDFDIADALEKSAHDDENNVTDVSEVECLALKTHDEQTDEESGIGYEMTLGSTDEVGNKTAVEEATALNSESETADQKKQSIIETKRRESVQKLERMGLVTALAIGIHNFPEGLATFVATLDDPAVGAALAVAIAIHNIPEGVCVAMPIFFANGNRHKAFMWAVVSGLSEVVAAGLGWLVLSHVLGDLVYAILFGGVSGMMVNICAYQLIPTAHKYDPEDKVVSHSILVGMMIMALSLVIFLY